MLKDIKGLKFPDDFFIKFFFKQTLHEESELKYLEFGCSNGNNLMLPAQYGNEVVGVDINPNVIELAKQNFKRLSYDNSQFYCSDMCNFVKNNKHIKADVFMLPNVACYITKQDFIAFLQKVVSNQVIKQGAYFFLRLRSLKDFRFGIGQQIEKDTFIMPEDSITDEAGALLTFYSEWDIVVILKEHLSLRDFNVFEVNSQNLQNDTVINNADIVIWGFVN